MEQSLRGSARWTRERDAYLRSAWPNTETDVILIMLAEVDGLPVATGHIQSRVKVLGVHRDRAFLAGKRKAAGETALKRERAVWPDDALDEAGRMWCETTDSRPKIVEALAAMGCIVSDKQLGYKASELGWNRPEIPGAYVPPSIRESRAALERLNALPVIMPDRVRRVPPGTHPAPPGGYRLGRGASAGPAVV